MATYTFAPEGAPVQDHMEGLLKGFEVWARDCQNRMDAARTIRDKSYWRGKRDGFLQAVETIKDSNSMEPTS